MIPKQAVTVTGVAEIRQCFAELMAEVDKDYETSEKGDPGDVIEIIGASFAADESFILGAPDLDYIVRETNWYDSQSLSVNDIAAPVPPIWKKIADNHGEINSNYGYLLFSEENGSQFEHAAEALIGDPSTRQAIAVYTRPSIHEDASKNGRSDFICTNTTQFLLRQTGDDDRYYLHMIVQMRSNDAVFGYRNDVAWQRIVQRRMIRRLQSAGLGSIKTGLITWQVGSLHIYRRHWPALREAIASEKWGQQLN